MSSGYIVVLIFAGQFKRGVSPSFLIPSPSPRVERGIKGVRLIKISLFP
jgi:hypothetical protein